MTLLGHVIPLRMATMITIIITIITTTTITTTTTTTTMTTVTIISLEDLEVRPKKKNLKLKKQSVLSWPLKTIVPLLRWDTSLKIWCLSVLSGDMTAGIMLLSTLSTGDWLVAIFYKSAHNKNDVKCDAHAFLLPLERFVCNCKKQIGDSFLPSNTLIHHRKLPSI